jgi:hypothetical protein
MRGVQQQLDGVSIHHPRAVDPHLEHQSLRVHE